MALRTRADTWPVAAVILTVSGLIAGVIVLGILLILADANQRNSIVDLVLDIGRWLTQPFHDLFPRKDPEENVLINWGIAALVYFALGGLLARLIRW